MRHLERKYDSLADRDAEFFKRNGETLKKTRLDEFVSYQQKYAAAAAVEASYSVA
jgi:hypothetical protein